MYINNISETFNPQGLTNVECEVICSNSTEFYNLRHFVKKEQDKFLNIIKGNANSTRDNSNQLKINEVIFNPPATVVFWSDGTKTVVKCNNENFDKEKGLAMAISKKTLGNKGSYFEVFKKYCDEQNDAEINIKDEMKKCLDKFYDIILKRNNDHEE